MQKYLKSTFVLAAVLGLFPIRAWCVGLHGNVEKASPSLHSQDSDWERFRYPVEMLEDKWTYYHRSHPLASESSMFQYPHFAFDLAIRFKLSYDDCSKMIRRWNRRYHHSVDPRLTFSRATYDARYRKDREAYIADWRSLQKRAEELDLKQYGPDEVKKMPGYPKHPEDMWVMPPEPAWVKQVEKDLATIPPPSR